MARAALIVATDRYGDSGLRRLRSPMGDAQRLARVLEDPRLGDFTVTPLLNEPSSVVRLRVQEFFRSAARDDLLLLYFSCHGIKDDSGRLFFATTDTQVKFPDATSVEASFVNEQMSRSRSSRVVLLLDCCYSGAFASGFVAKAGDSVDLKERFEGRGRVVLTASSAMEYSFEGDAVSGSGQGSVFTRELISGLETGAADQNGDGMVSVDELYDFLHDRVREHTPNQTPGKWAFQVAGELVLARSPLPPRVRTDLLPAELVAGAAAAPVQPPPTSPPPPGAPSPRPRRTLPSRRAATIAAAAAVLVVAVVFVVVRLAGSSPPSLHNVSTGGSTSTASPSSSPAAPTTVSVPHVYGKPHLDAEKALQDLGFHVQAQTVCSGTVGAGLVRQVLLAAGTAAAQGVAGPTDPYGNVIVDDAGGVSDAGRSLASGTALLLKVSDGTHC